MKTFLHERFFLLLIEFTEKERLYMCELNDLDSKTSTQFLHM